ncbi:MAG: flagellar motor switch protein FliN [Gammaproteobacteria bacterium]
MSEAELAEAGAAEDWAAAMAEQAAVEAGQAAGGSKDSVQAAPLEDLKPGAIRSDAPANLEAILDIPVTLSVQIGATKISIRNLLQLNQGSVVELDRLAGEPLDVLVNGTLVAHGEVVVVNEKFGIRLTDVVSAQERVRKLQ